METTITRTGEPELPHYDVSEPLHEECYDIPSKRFNKAPRATYLSDTELRSFAKRIAEYVTKRTVSGLDPFEFQIEFHGVAAQVAYNVETREEVGTRFMGQSEWIGVIQNESTVVTDAWCLATYEDLPRVVAELNKLLA